MLEDSLLAWIIPVRKMDRAWWPFTKLITRDNGLKSGFWKSGMRLTVVNLLSLIR